MASGFGFVGGCISFVVTLACVIITSQSTISTDFFIVVNFTLAAGNGIQVNCRGECAIPANDKQLLVGGNMAWIMSVDENKEVVNLINEVGFVSGDSIALGGSRSPSGSTWYWAEQSPQILGRSPQGIPFYEGVTARQGGYALRYQNFLSGEPSNSSGRETQVAFIFKQSRWGWNDANVFDNSVHGCMCRRIRTLSSSSSAAVSRSVSPLTSISTSAALTTTISESESAKSTSTFTLSSSDMSSVTLTENDGLSLSLKISRSQTASGSLSQYGETQTHFPSPSFRDTTLSSSRSIPPQTPTESRYHLSFSNTSIVTPTCSLSRWSCGTAFEVYEIYAALEPPNTPLCLSSASCATSSVPVVLTSTSVVAQKDNVGTPTILFTSTDLPRIQLLACVPLVLNLTIAGPRSAVWWRVSNVTIKNQQLNFTATDINFFNWWLLVIECPGDGRWVNPAFSRYLDTVMELQIAMSCDQVAPILIGIVLIPSPALPPELAAEVKTAGRYAQIGSALFSSVAGSAIGRMMAIRSLAFCNVDSAVSGGLIDLDFEVCDDQHLAAVDAAVSVARSAVLGNIVLLASISVLSAVLSVAAWRSKTIFFAALRLPSSLLPVWVAAVDRRSRHTAAWATRIKRMHHYRRCARGPWDTDLTGALCWYPLRVVRPCTWGSTTVAMRALPTLLATSRRRPCWWRPWRLLMRCFTRTWKWEATGATNALHFPQLQHAWLLLLEYRFVWYAAIDALALAVLACVGIVSGLSPTNTVVCEAFAVVAAVILMLQLTLVFVVRPYTTIFAHYYTLAVLLLTTLSVIAQLVLLFSFAGLDSWLLQGSAVCNLATVGVGLTKTLTDLAQLGRAVARRVGLACSDNGSKVSEVVVELPMAKEESQAVQLSISREKTDKDLQFEEFDDVPESLDLHFMPLAGTDLVNAIHSDILAIGTHHPDKTSDFLSMFSDSFDTPF
ncbi:membrane-associated protein, putative [Bodo saltans]|uniref:Membrane-associated protein, putative n=1 Tax=Bodo saltans TaxID=75058 RepID=A0A0S4ITF8_BODSA|nr:membrane-associated protein, putative [Bodo saltans]|eukprot:CUG06551.1 membrane-associated protein, putative [Bodo saltans]